MSIASGNKQRALKFLKMAQRLNHNLSVNDLFHACGNLDSASSPAAGDEKRGGDGVEDGDNQRGPVRKEGGLNGEERGYTEEHVKLIREIKRNADYYAILGVHPDKNKAPGSEEAFKKLCKAFKCLSDGNSRRQYDQVGLVEEFESDQRFGNVRQRRRRRRDVNAYYDDDFDPDEIFRSFFGQSDMFRTQHVYRARGMGAHHREEDHGGGFNVEAFDEKFPPGSPARANIEDSVIHAELSK
ncbi:hypothetical protein Tsubulata_016277 [Turnera subulata]|uniref:J domain-containing protein n=1 Tax=Turnera subulata TaxID=218843 RepID=A0A9Q0FM61_9ROSI|nr:hypothetical protein Tsubulata_016277 [Turnera subulata]